MVILLNYTLRKMKGKRGNKWQLTVRLLWGCQSVLGSAASQNADAGSNGSGCFLAPPDCRYTEMPNQILKHFTLPTLKTMRVKGHTVK